MAEAVDLPRRDDNDPGESLGVGGASDGDARRAPAHHRFRPSLPLLLLLLALSTVFLVGNEQRGLFYRSGHHNWNTAGYLTIATNLSPEHNFLLFRSRTLDADGVPLYKPYSRFPIGGYALIKLAILPFGNDFSAQIYAARMMFLFFYAGSAVLTYLSLCRLTAERWIALTATLLAFSSYYLLYYNDMPATENGLSLFGLLLTFHGMVLFVQEDRFRQLLIKACAALLLGWHVYALLLPFIVLGLLRDLNRARRLSAPPSLAGQFKRCVAALLFSRYLTLGVVTLLFGLAVLSFNLGNEYRALDGEVPLTELPTAKSMKYRLGADDEFNERFTKALEWENFLGVQFYRIAGATLPFYINPFNRDELVAFAKKFQGATLPFHINPFNKDYLGVIVDVIVGALASGLSVIGLLVARQKMLLTTLVSAGFCWALPMRHNTLFHDYESVFYIGIPLLLFSMGLSCLQRLFGDRLLVGLSAAALLVFVLSSFQMGRVGHDQQASELQEAVVADFEAIRTIAEAGQSVFVPVSYSLFAGKVQAVHYYLAGRMIGFSWHAWPDSFAYDFFVSRKRVAVPALLTPENRQIFLYRQRDYSEQIDEMIRKAELLIRGWFDVYRSGNRLIYVRNRSKDRAAQFIGQNIPIVSKPFYATLSPVVRSAGFTDRSRWQWERGSDAEGWTNVPAPTGPGRTYVYRPTTADIGRQLRAYVYYTDSRGNRVKAMTLPSLPVQPSSATGLRFFLHIIPVDVDDLPDHRKQQGFDNLDFRFGDYALPPTGGTVAVRELPAYDIARIRTGQYTDEGIAWEGEIRFDK